MKYYAVIDTNVIVSSFLQPDSIPGKVIDLILNETIIPIVSDGILFEYQEVLFRNKFKLDPNLVLEFLRNYTSKAIVLDETESLEQFIDKDDVKFYEIALTGYSTYDARLVTGNIRHFPKHRMVVTPREMLEIIEFDQNKREV